MSKPAAEANWKVAIKDIISGTFGGIAQALAGHPLDTVKVRLQTQDTKAPQFSGMTDCFRKTIKNEGIRGLYRGMMSPMAGAMGLNASLFFSYGQSQVIMRHIYKVPEPAELPITQIFIAGGMAGAFTSFVESPFDLVKIKLQSQVGEGQYKGVLDTTRKIIRGYGLRGIYQGLQATLIRDVPAFAGYFASYEWARRALTPKGQEASLLNCFLAGGVGGFGFWGVVYPLEMVKTRIQTDALDRNQRVYKSWLDCWNKTYREQGFAGMWKGYTPSIIRAVGVNAVVFLTVTAAKRQMQ